MQGMQYLLPQRSHRVSFSVRPHFWAQAVHSKPPSQSEMAPPQFPGHEYHMDFSSTRAGGHVTFP